MAKNKYTNIEDDGDDAWKKKYYANLELLEQKEIEWQESDKILRTLITYLGNAADNSYPKLTKQVDVLEKNIKQGVSPLKLKKAIDEISITISELNGYREQKKLSLKSHLLNLVKNISPAGKIDKKVRKIEKQLAKLSTEKELTPLIDELASLLVNGIRLAEKEKPKSGLLSSLLSKHDKPEATETEQQPVSEHAEKEEAEITEHDDFKDAIKSLTNLIERMILPGDLQVEANLVKRDLLIAGSPEVFLDGLEKTLQIVATILGRIKQEKQDIEDFLKQLTDRLYEMDSDLVSAGKLRLLSNQQGHTMSDAVKKEMRDMEAGINHIQNIDELKTAVQSSVVLLRHHVDTFMLDEDKQNKTSVELIARLQAKVKQMEKESEQLKQQLEDEREQTLKDALTEVPNRLAYEERLKTELARYHRKMEPFVLVVWDIDFFKKVNDTYGHASGDKVLKVVAKTLSSQLRETDFFARYGGEEFVSILPDTDLNGAQLITDKLRESIYESEFHFRDQPVKITVSCGYAVIKENETGEACFIRADKALYQAKEKGRNRCQAAN